MPSGLSWTACVEGHLHEADGLADSALAAAEEFEVAKHPMIADALRTRGRVLYERGRLDDAEPWLERAVAVSERARPAGVFLGSIRSGATPDDPGPLHRSRGEQRPRAVLSAGRLDRRVRAAARRV